MGKSSPILHWLDIFVFWLETFDEGSSLPTGHASSNMLGNALPPFKTKERLKRKELRVWTFTRFKASPL